MAPFEISIDDEKIQELLEGDRGMAVLLEPVLNQILQAEMTDHLGAEPGERTDDRNGYRNGSYQRGGRVRLSDNPSRHDRTRSATGLERNVAGHLDGLDRALPALSAFVTDVSV